MSQLQCLDIARCGMVILVRLACDCSCAAPAVAQRLRNELVKGMLQRPGCRAKGMQMDCAGLSGALGA